MSNLIAYTADTIYTGIDKLVHHAIVVNEGRIEEIIPAVSVSDEIELVDFGDTILAPAFIDVQLYGAHGRLLSVYPDADTVAAIYEYSKNGGASYCMPTVATNSYEVIFKCIDAIRDYWRRGGRGVLGLHVEGPWINPLKKGAHIESLIFSPTVEQAQQLLGYGKGVIRMITIAPEICSPEVMQLLQRDDIVISAGHSNATYEEANKAFNNGILTATHLYNAMSAFQHRAPGMVGAIFDHDSVKCSIVPDGYHVDYAAIRIAKKMMGERLFVITDAVTETLEGLYPHVPDGDKYISNGILSGSALTMVKAMQNLVKYAGISIPEALRMCSLYPARLLKMSDEVTLLKKGYPAYMLVLDSYLNIVHIII